MHFSFYFIIMYFLSFGWVCNINGTAVIVMPGYVGKKERAM